MGVVTTADDKIEELKQHLNEAYKAVTIVLDDNTWGHDHFTKEYLDKLLEVMLDIVNVKNKLK